MLHSETCTCSTCIYVIKSQPLRLIFTLSHNVISVLFTLFVAAQAINSSKWTQKAPKKSKLYYFQALWSHMITALSSKIEASIILALLKFSPQLIVLLWVPNHKLSLMHLYSLNHQYLSSNWHQTQHTWPTETGCIHENVLSPVCSFVACSRTSYTDHKFGQSPGGLPEKLKTSLRNSLRDIEGLLAPQTPETSWHDGWRSLPKYCWQENVDPSVSTMEELLTSPTKCIITTIIYDYDGWEPLNLVK